MSDYRERAFRILPVYTGDVSGACSALFELGGMVCIHDPSGCNSTYNTHDETRWYDHDSLIFISGLTERQAIVGADDTLVADVCAAATELRPRFVALCNSPIPYIAGTDFLALCRLIERRTEIPCLYVPTSGMHDYVRGAGGAFRVLAERFLTPRARRPRTANVLGLTPLDFCTAEAVREATSVVGEAGLTLISSWAMGSDLDMLMEASAASVNLVVSATGMAVARLMYERFQIPYVVGRPMPGTRDKVAEALVRASEDGTCQTALPPRTADTTESTTFVVGEPVWAASMAASLTSKDTPVRLVVTVEADPELAGERDVRATSEEDVERALAGATRVYADPLYQPVVPTGAELVSCPHFAFSGRAALRALRELA